MNRVEIMVAGHGWVVIPMKDVLEGDVFRLFEPDGTPIQDDNGNTTFISSCDAYEEEVFYGQEKIWVIESED